MSGGELCEQVRSLGEVISGLDDSVKNYPSFIMLAGGSWFGALEFFVLYGYFRSVTSCPSGYSDGGVFVSCKCGEV